MTLKISYFPSAADFEIFLVLSEILVFLHQSGDWLVADDLCVFVYEMHHDRDGHGRFHRLCVCLLIRKCRIFVQKCPSVLAPCLCHDHGLFQLHSD